MAEMLVDSTKLDACLDAEADAIRAKTGGSADIPFDFANNKGFADAIAAIPSGGDDQGIFDITFNKTIGSATMSGIVENNAFRAFTVNQTYYTPPLMLKQPISLQTGDVVEFTIKNPAFGGMFMTIFLISAFGRVISGREAISIFSNTRIPNTTTITYTYNGEGTVIESLGVTSNNGNLTNASAELSLSINGTVLF